MQKPQTKKEDTVEDIDGISVSDPYRWIEDGKSKEVVDWTEKQSKYTDSFLKNKNQEVFSRALSKDFKTHNFFTPTYVNGRYFYSEQYPDNDHKTYYIKNELNGKSVVLLDLNIREDSGEISLDYWSIGNTGKYVAYGLSRGGNEMATMYIIDVNTKEHTLEYIPNCRYSSIAWLPDDSGFFYTRHPQVGSVPENEEHLHRKVYLHAIGEDPTNDELIFGDNRPIEDMISLSLSPDGIYLAIEVAQTWTENEVYIYDVKKKSTRLLVGGIEAEFSPNILCDKIILHTNYKANNYRIISTSLNNMFIPIDEWEEFVPEKDCSLKSVAVTRDKILLNYNVNVSSEIVILNHFGKKIGSIPIPEHSSVTKISSRITEKEFFYAVASFTFPRIMYRYDPKKENYEIYKALDNPINPDDYVIEQKWCVSKDDTQVPMFIIRKKEITLDGMSPTLLLGYGGFSSSINPFFLKSWIPWLERGGVFAVANIRGGGEFGSEWHIGGVKENKQNSFDDFIACAEFLISEKYTNTEKLGVIGSSNGGLLISAVIVQRPELFKAGVAQVPLTDMVRFPQFGMAVRWVHEYGNPSTKEDLKRILKWSPYHNVRNGVEYPNILITTGENDTRVNPLHSRKMIAMFQSANDKNKALLFTEKEAGHATNKPIFKIIETQSLIITFFAQELELPMI